MLAKKNYSVIIFMVLFLIGISSFLIFMNKRGLNQVEAQEYPAVSQEKCFTYVEIKRGDSLWKIAGEHMTPQYPSRNAYIDEIKEMNHMSSNDLVAGASIIVPYYRETAADLH